MRKPSFKPRKQSLMPRTLKAKKKLTISLPRKIRKTRQKLQQRKLQMRKPQKKTKPKQQRTLIIKKLKVSTSYWLNSAQLLMVKTLIRQLKFKTKLKIAKISKSKT
jgi:hypothetical protein